MRKPAEALPDCPSERTTISVCRASRDALDTIRFTLQEWFLGHSDPEVRREALHLSVDRALRIVLASFARDYRVSLPSKEESLS